MNIEHISVSRKGCFDTCHLQYKYKYHLKILPEGEEPFYFTYGKIIHKIAEMYVENQGQIPFDDVVKNVLDGKVEIENGIKAPKLPIEYQFRLPEHLRSLKKLNEQVGASGQPEYAFRYDLDFPNGKYIKGFIDRIIQKGDKFFIIDYKTTKRGIWRKNLTNITDDLQLRCYARVVQKQFKAEAKNIRAALYYLEGGDMIGAKFTDESLKFAETQLLDAYNQIATMDADSVVGNVGKHCFRCDYKHKCPFYAIERGKK